MSFSFLNPWFWLAAMAVAAPVWLHLRRRKEQNLVRFAAVRFLEDQPKSRRRPLSVRDTSLLLLRALAVILIVAAFARPCLPRANHLNQKESVVYILDNTLSRQVDSGFVKDRDRIGREIENAAPAMQFSVIELTSQPRVVSRFGEDRALVKQKIQLLRPSYQRGSYLSAFRQANSLLSEISGQKRRIVLLGDSQAYQWEDRLNSPPFLQNVQIELPKAASERLPNLWLSDGRAQRLFEGDKAYVNFSLRLNHLGPARRVKVGLRANGRMVMDRVVELENQPKSTLIQAQCEADPAAWVRADASVEGSPDALAADNHFYFAVPPEVQRTAALLARSPYLRVALSPEVMRGQWKTRLLDPAKLEQEVSSGPAEEVLCLESAYLQSSAARHLLELYRTSGRGVFLLIDETSPAIDGCLRELGFELDPQPVASEPKAERLQFVSSGHSIFHPFQSGTFENLSDVTVSHYATVRATEARPLIFAEKGAGLLFESTKGPGKLFVSAFGMDREKTSWPIHPTFIPFLDLTLKAACPRDSSPTAFEPGDLATLHLSADLSARTLVIRADGRALERAVVEQGRTHLHMPDQPGIYALTLDDREQIHQWVCVNTPDKESDLEFVSAHESLKSWRLPASQGPGHFPPASVVAAGVSERQQHLWWWLLAGALLAMTCETILIGREGRHRESG